MGALATEGGSSPGVIFDDAWLLSESGEWQEITAEPRPPARGGHAAANLEISSLGECVGISGGNTLPDQVQTLTDLWIFSEISKTWKKVEVDLKPRIGQSIVPLRKNNFLILGGRDLSTNPPTFFEAIELVTLEVDGENIRGRVREFKFPGLERTGCAVLPAPGGFVVTGGFGDFIFSDDENDRVKTAMNAMEAKKRDRRDRRDRRREGEFAVDVLHFSVSNDFKI